MSASEPRKAAGHRDVKNKSKREEYVLLRGGKTATEAVHAGSRTPAGAPRAEEGREADGWPADNREADLDNATRLQ